MARNSIRVQCATWLLWCNFYGIPPSAVQCKDILGKVNRSISRASLMHNLHSIPLFCVAWADRNNAVDAIWLPKMQQRRHGTVFNTLDDNALHLFTCSYCYLHLEIGLTGNKAASFRITRSLWIWYPRIWNGDLKEWEKGKREGTEKRK